MTQKNTVSDDTIDLKELFFSIISQWKIISLCMILSLILALMYLRITPNTYSTDALIQVEDKKGVGASALLGELGNLANAGGNSAAIAESEILRSRSVLSKVIKNLTLDISIERADKGLFERLSNPKQPILEYTAEGVRYVDSNTSIFIEQLDIPAYYKDRDLRLDFLNQNEYVIKYKEEQVFKGNLNQVSTETDQNGIWQVRINSNIASNHSVNVKKLSEPAAVKNISATYNVSERGKNSGILELKVQGEDPTHITKVLNDILNVYHENNILRKSLESKQTLSFLDKQLPEIKRQLEGSEQKFNQFREDNNTVDINQESQLLLKQNIELDTKRFELKQKQAELSARYTNDFPLMVEINSQIAALEKKSNELSSTLTQLPEKQRQYLQLYRDVQVNTQLYTNLLNSYQQLKIAEAGEIGNVRIIDHAIKPVKEIKPQKLIILALGLIAGLFVGIMIALGRNLLRSGIQNAKDIENELDLPVYATVPRSEKQERRIKILRKKKQLPILAAKHSDDIAIESLRSIRTAIHFALMNAKNNAIMLSGPAPELGKSFISVNLATIFAQSGKRVLLIDGDIRRGYLHKYFNQATQPGLSNYLLTTSSLEQVTHHTDIENLDFMSRGVNPPNPSELLNSARFQELLEILNEQYDYVIIDTPPVLAVTDPVIVSRYAGINLLIARFGRTNIKELETSIDRFEQAGSKITGVILNDVQRTASSGYNYNYNYAYTATKED
ncbi:polysaccharide biosynthesis tyrosine autokinase [Acinetobacter sp. c1-l78]|uniref:polysaccharide biosynthesis tyrosine autokinase n=1 Tax=Acinetobacter sp. c1-l78 TaxID=3342803 RepID=UPI0035B8C0A5